MALAVLWTGVAIAAHGTALALPTLLAAGGGVAWLAWLAHRQSRAVAAHAAGPGCASATALLEATLADDLDAVLAHGAALLGASRVWLRVDAPLLAQSLDWPPTAQAAAPAWWRDALAAEPRWVCDTGPLACVVQLRHRDVAFGVLAFERDAAAQAFSTGDTQAASAVAMLMTHLLLSRHLEARLDELGEQQARERRMFLSRLSHKLRTPMTAILGFAQILALDDGLEGEHREFVREIEAAGQSLLDMLNELLGVTRD
jgi:signal transduction histidine kinase